jgi:hypothetical protein
MVKKLTAFFAILAFASFASVGSACDTSCKGDKDSGDGSITSSGVFDVAGSGCGGGSCGKKDRDNP